MRLLVYVPLWCQHVKAVIACRCYKFHEEPGKSTSTFQLPEFYLNGEDVAFIEDKVIIVLNADKLSITLTQSAYTRYLRTE